MYSCACISAHESTRAASLLRLSRGAYSRASAREPGAVRKPGMLEHQEAEEEDDAADVVYDTNHV